MKKLLVTGVLFGAAAAASTAGAEVTLRSLDGTISISGELVSYEDGVFTISSAIGEFVIPGNNVNCEGEECPVADELGQEIRIMGAHEPLSVLLPRLLDEYALNEDADALVTAAPDGANSIDILRGDETLATVQTRPGSAEEAFAALLAGEVEMIVTERRATQDEVQAFQDAGLGDLYSAERETIFAQDGLVPVVSPSNPLTSLSLDQLEGIFSGRITNWSQLGGANTPITAYLPSEGSDLSEQFYTFALEPNFGLYSDAIQRVDSVRAVSDAVASDPGAIGVVSNPAIGAAKPLAMQLSCGIETGLSRFRVKAEDYPMSRRLYVYTSGRRVPSRTADLVEMFGGDLGQQIIDTTEYFSQTPTATDFDELGNQLAFGISDPTQLGELNNLIGFVGEARTADRLSTTFRFATGSSNLDNKARADAQRLASLLSGDGYAQREVLLVGFTDSIGRSDVNTVLSVRRAQQVLDEILAASGGSLAPGKFNALGYGASYPVSCNTDEGGRELNRRVEVWLR